MPFYQALFLGADSSDLFAHNMPHPTKKKTIRSRSKLPKKRGLEIKSSRVLSIGKAGPILLMNELSEMGQSRRIRKDASTTPLMPGMILKKAKPVIVLTFP